MLKKMIIIIYIYFNFGECIIIVAIFNKVMDITEVILKSTEVQSLGRIRKINIETPLDFV